MRSQKLILIASLLLFSCAQTEERVLTSDEMPSSKISQNKNLLLVARPNSTQIPEQDLGIVLKAFEQEELLESSLKVRLEHTENSKFHLGKKKYVAISAGDGKIPPIVLANGEESFSIVFEANGEPLNSRILVVVAAEADFYNDATRRYKDHTLVLSDAHILVASSAFPSNDGVDVPMGDPPKR